MRRTSSSDTGASLVGVLILLSLLSGLIALFITMSRERIRSVFNKVQAAKAESLSNAGVEMGRALLGMRTDPTPADGSMVLSCTTAEGRLTVFIEDEAGKVDLNAAPPSLLAALLELRYEVRSAESMAETIVDFRDADTKTLNLGDEIDAYLAEGRDHGPKDQPFERIDELYQVAGLPVEAVRFLLPNVTVYARRSGIDPNEAGLAVLSAWAGASPATFEEMAGAPEHRDRDLRFLRNTGGAFPSMRSPKSVYSIHAHAVLHSGSRHSRLAIVERMPGGRSRILEFDRSETPLQLDAAPHPDDEFTPCRNVLADLE